jgi:hypothetical protein
VVKHLTRTNSDSCYGDLAYVDRTDMSRIIRYWKSGEYDRGRFLTGWMPPHPTFFARKSVFEDYGIFNTTFPIAADYELMLRFLFRYNVTSSYIPETLVRMRIGGRSRPGVANTAKAMSENYRAWKINGLTPKRSVFLLKPLSKLIQYARPWNWRTGTHL